jgi:hypothetical protein
LDVQTLMTWLLIAIAWVGVVPALFVLSARRLRAGLDSGAVARRRAADDPRTARDSASA